MTAALWVEAAISTIVISLRFWSRHLTRSIGLDNWSMLVATVSCCSHYAFDIIDNGYPTVVLTCVACSYWLCHKNNLDDQSGRLPAS